jgi:diadenosine tetraphosphate (Ap4A) HIT family hydrolase
MKKEKLPEPKEEEIIFNDDTLYVCLARFPITKGHTVVVLKKEYLDLHSVEKDVYTHFMVSVDITRNALLTHYHLEKAYLIYMDEIQSVHMHIVPRYEEQGFNVFNHIPSENTDTSDVEVLKKTWITERAKLTS